MTIWEKIFGNPIIRNLPPVTRREVNNLLVELVQIGKLDDFLSLQPGGLFDIHCHHVYARRIGKRLNDLGGLALMQAARTQIKQKLQPVLAEHLDYCWEDIGDWQP